MNLVVTAVIIGIVATIISIIYFGFFPYSIGHFFGIVVIDAVAWCAVGWVVYIYKHYITGEIQ